MPHRCRHYRYSTAVCRSVMLYNTGFSEEISCIGMIIKLSGFGIASHEQRLRCLGFSVKLPSKLTYVSSRVPSFLSLLRQHNSAFSLCWLIFLVIFMLLMLSCSAVGPDIPSTSYRSTGNQHVMIKLKISGLPVFEITIIKVFY